MHGIVLHWGYQHLSALISIIYMCRGCQLVGVYITMCRVRWFVLEVSMDLGDAVCMLVRSRHCTISLVHPYHGNGWFSSLTPVLK